MYIRFWGRQVIVACVRTGTRYDFTYVTKLRNMVERWCDGFPYRMVCLTDQPDRCEGVKFIDIRSVGLEGWWAKLVLLQEGWRKGDKVIFLDLDTVICGGLAPLFDVWIDDTPMLMPENFARLAGSTSWPCKFNSSIIVINENMGNSLWECFDRNRGMMERAGKYGDQMVLEWLCPQAPFLQWRLPKGYLLNYRNLGPAKPDAAAIINFGGRHKPHNTTEQWVKDAWT